MSGVNIEYKGESIATIPDTGSKTIKTQGKYCEGDILVEYEAPPTPQPTLITKQITENGTYAAEDETPPADGYSEVTVEVEPYYSNVGIMYYSKMDFPSTVSKIQSQAYRQCLEMKEVKISSSIKVIEDLAFFGTPITKLVMEEGIEVIKNNAFYGNKLLEIALPKSIKTIEQSSLATIQGNVVVDLSAFTDTNTIPNLMNSNAFANVAYYEVADQQMLNAFESATNWSAYAGKYVIKGATS